MSINSVVNDTVTSVSLINAQKPLPPTITNYSVGGLDDTALDPAGGQTVQINGTGFLAGATITFDGNAVAVVTYVNPNRLTFTSPAKSAGTYTIYVVNPDGGTAIFIPGIIYSLLPTWTTSAGTLGSYYETTSISNTVVASGDAPITYSLYSGSLPTGATLYANGVITGTAPVDSSSTTYSFTIEAIDAQLQGSTRSFSLTINTDVVTWVSPANATTYTSAVDSAIANVTLSATDAAGYAVSYSANALPTGLSISGSNISGTPTVVADSSTLLTATAATTNRTATRTINWSITVAGDIYFEYNTLLIPGASTTFVDDASTNNFAVTINGDTKPNSMNPYSPGYYSNYLDGTGDYLVTPTNSAFTFGTGDLTLECWVYQTATSVSTYRVIFADNVYGDTGGYTLYSYNNALNLWKGGSGGVQVIAPAGTITLNTWTHIAWTRSGSSNRLFINGTQVGATTTDATNYTSTASYIGASQAGTLAFNGYISNARIVKGTAVYTSNFTPSTTPLTAISGTSLLTCQSNRFIDNSTNNFSITVFGNTTVKSFDPFIPNSSYSTYGSGYFDGTGDYLITPTDTAFTFGTGDFTIECWVYLTNSSATTQTIMGADLSVSTGSIQVWYNNVANKITFNVYGDPQFVSSSTVSIGNWIHLAFTRSSGTFKMFINGTQSASGSMTNNLPNNKFVIGRGYATIDAEYSYGYISDVRVVKGTAVYTTAFTPPTSPLTAISGTSLLTLQNNQSVNNNVFLDNSTNNFFVTRNGNTTQGTFSPYGGNWSNYFDGTGDYLSATGTALNLVSGDFTVEAWIYIVAGSTYQFIIGSSDNSAGYMMIGINVPLSPTSTIAVGRSGINWPLQFGSSITFASNTWYHIAITRSGTTNRAFINGVQLGSNVTDSTSWSFPSNTMWIGNQTGGTAFNGYMTDVRIVKGTAVYTSAFTPSTTPLTPIAGTSLLTCADNRLIDDSINNFTITKNGDVSVQRFSPFNPSSVTPTSYSGYFDGTGDYLTTPASATCSFGTSSLTLEGWFYLTSASSEKQLFRNGLTWPTNVWTLVYNHSFAANKLCVITGNYSQSTYLIASANSLTLNTWNHIAVVRNVNSWQIYINGVADGSSATWSGSVDGGSSSALFGVGGDSTTLSGLTWIGYISNFRAVNGTAVYTGTFTPPTSPLTAISGTSLLTLQSPTFVDNSTNNFTITAAGNSKPVTQNPFGYTSTTTTGYTVSTIGGSGYFDGTGDNLSLTAVTAVGTSNTTVEFWFYPTSASVTYRGIYDSRSATDTNTGYGIFQYGLTIEVYGNGLKVASAANAFAINVWNHVALVRTSGTCQLYINGIASGSTGSYSSDLTSTVRRIGDSVNTSYPFVGYISDVREATTALYTSNFVPSLTPLTAVQNTVLLTNMSGAGIYDAAMMNDLETVGNAKLSTAISKFGESSMSFDGSGDWFTAPSNPIFAFGTGDFTVEAWVYLNAIPTALTYPSIIEIGTNFFINFRGNGTLALTDATTLYAQSSSSLLVNTWYYVAVVRASGSSKIYINGTGGTAVTCTVNFPQSTASIGGGAGSTASGSPFSINGYIDDLRVTKGYARYTSNFTPPTTAFPVY